MKTLKNFWQWLLVIFIIGLIFYQLMFVFTSPVPPIRLADIPKETIDFINRITDQGIIINTHPDPDDWNNDKAGEDYLADYKSIEDTNFIVYYLPKTIAAERAKIALKNANSAVKPLEQVMGVYFYPYQVNNRKLPIYITNSNNEYDAMVQHFVHCDGGGSVGITCFELSSFGFRTMGIIISKDAWANADFARMVLWHEMNHYVFLTAIDIEKNPAPLTWVIEGIAEYFTQNKMRLSDVDKTKCRNIYLAEELKSHFDNYWVGYTAMLSAEKTFGRSTVRSFIRQNFVSPVKPSIQNVFQTNLSNFESGWRTFVNDLP